MCSPSLFNVNRPWTYKLNICWSSLSIEKMIIFFLYFDGTNITSKTADFNCRESFSIWNQSNSPNWIIWNTMNIHLKILHNLMSTPLTQFRLIESPARIAYKLQSTFFNKLMWFWMNWLNKARRHCVFCLLENIIDGEQNGPFQLITPFMILSSCLLQQGPSGQRHYSWFRILNWYRHRAVPKFGMFEIE